MSERMHTGTVDAVGNTRADYVSRCCGMLIADVGDPTTGVRWSEANAALIAAAPTSSKPSKSCRTACWRTRSATRRCRGRLRARAARYGALTSAEGRHA